MCLPFLSELELVKISRPCLSLNTKKGSELFFFMCLLYQFKQFLETFPIEPPFLYEIDLHERKIQASSPFVKIKKLRTFSMHLPLFYNCSLS